MLATAARPQSARGQQETVRTPEAAEALVRRPAPEEAVLRAAPAPRRPSFLFLLMRALSAVNV